MIICLGYCFITFIVNQFCLGRIFEQTEKNKSVRLPEMWVFSVFCDGKLNIFWCQYPLVFPRPKITSTNVLFCLQPKDILFTVMDWKKLFFF